MRYYIIAGEASGDLHGSNLMKGIYSQDAEATIRFWGGDCMNEVFLQNEKQNEKQNENRGNKLNEKAEVSSPLSGGLVQHFKEGAIMGFWEVFIHASKLLSNVSRCKSDLLAFAPDAVILIDYPGFNFKIAEFAHKQRLKTFYYIAPKVWASREGRIKKLKKYVDKLFIVFPFEIPYFKSKNVEFIYRGNPLVDAVDGSRAMAETKLDFIKRNHLENKPIIAMLAGSRKNEISTMMPVLTEFARKMHSISKYSDYLFLIAGAPARELKDYASFLADSEVSKYVKVLFGETQSIIKHSEAAVVNSGTASLETVLFGTPQVVGYIGSRLTYLIAKHIVKIKYISLGNLIIGRQAFKEFIQDDCNADALVKETRALIEDARYRNKMVEDYREIREMLGGKGASDSVAKAMTDLLNGRPCSALQDLP